MYMVASITGVIISSVVIVSYFWQQQQILAKLQQQAKEEEEARQQALELEQKRKESVNSISVELTKLTTEKTSSYFSADIELNIHNKGTFTVSLDKATITLFLNSVNVQTKGFQEEILVIGANEYATYTATMVTFDDDGVRSLQDASEYSVILELSADAKCESYSSAIRVQDKETWS